MPRLIWSQEARENIAGISHYLEQFDAGLAIGTLQSIAGAADILTRFPALGPIHSPETRSLRVKRTNYVIVYSIREESIVILHIYHERQDWRAP